MNLIGWNHNQNMTLIVCLFFILQLETKFYDIYILSKGDTVVEWLALLPHSKKISGLAGTLMWSLDFLHLLLTRY